MHHLPEEQREVYYHEIELWRCRAYDPRTDKFAWSYEVEAQSAREAVSFARQLLAERDPYGIPDYSKLRITAKKSRTIRIVRMSPRPPQLGIASTLEEAAEMFGVDIS